MVSLVNTTQPVLCSADGLVDDAVRRELLSLLVTDEMSPFPPAELWEHSTVDDASAPRPTWGLRKHVLDCLKSAAPLMEVHTRLQKLYPELSFFHMPSEHMTLNREDKNVPLGHTLKTGCGTSTYSERVGHPSNAGTNREQFPHGMRRAGRTSSVDAICTDHNHQMQQVARQLSYQQQPRRQQGRPSKRQCIPTEQVAATDQPQGVNVQLPSQHPAQLNRPTAVWASCATVSKDSLAQQVGIATGGTRHAAGRACAPPWRFDTSVSTCMLACRRPRWDCERG